MSFVSFLKIKLWFCSLSWLALVRMGINKLANVSVQTRSRNLRYQLWRPVLHIVLHMLYYILAGEIVPFVSEASLCLYLWSLTFFVPLFIEQECFRLFLVTSLATSFL